MRNSKPAAAAVLALIVVCLPACREPVAEAGEAVPTAGKQWPAPPVAAPDSDDAESAKRSLIVIPLYQGAAEW